MIRPPPGAPLLHAVEALGLAALRARGFVRRHVATDHGVVHVLDAPGTGSGPPMLLIHGLGSAGADLAPLLLRLRPHTRRLIVPDLPGHGWSPLPDVEEPALHDALVQAIDQLVDGPVVGIGNSLGGLVTVRWALERPELAAGLVLMSPGGASVAPGELTALLGSFELRTQADAVRFMDRVLAGPGVRPVRWLHAWGVRHRMARPGPRAVLEGASPEHLLTPAELGALAAPTLVLWGRQDDVLPASHLGFWRRHLPGHAILEEPEVFGHSPYLDAPDLLVTRILDFVGR